MGNVPVFVVAIIAVVALGFFAGWEAHRLIWDKHINQASNLKIMESLASENNSTMQWDEWYKKLQRYSEATGMGAEAITGAGEEDWKEWYDYGYSIGDAFMEMFGRE